MSTRQAQIEKELGVTPELANYINNYDTPATKTFRSLLITQVSVRESAGMAMLESSRDDCHDEMLDLNDIGG